MPLSIVVDEALKVEASLPTNEAISPVEKFVPVIVNVILPPPSLSTSVGVTLVTVGLCSNETKELAFLPSNYPVSELYLNWPIVLPLWADVPTATLVPSVPVSDTLVNKSCVPFPGILLIGIS